VSRKTQAPNERARTSFLLYYQLGPERSLRRLHQQLQALGVRISLATLKRYSRRFSWQQQVASLDAEAEQRRRERSLQQVATMLERHAQVARAVQGAGGSALQKLMSSDRRLAEMRPSEIARLLDLGLRAERTAFAETADRHEIAVAIWNVVISDIVRLFKKVNEEPDPGVRARLFARGVDRIVDEHLDHLMREEG
jgi:hypothetical protein